MIYSLYSTLSTSLFHILGGMTCSSGIVCTGLGSLLNALKVWAQIPILYNGKFFIDVKTLANLAINSFLLKLRVADLVLQCRTPVQESKFAQ